MKRSIGLFAALATALTVGLMQVPAQAAPKLERYYAVSQQGDSLLGWFWIDEIDGIIGCAQCGWMVDLAKSTHLTPDAEKLFQYSLMTGMGKTSDAYVTADPRAADKLRREAINSFTTAARALGAASVRPGVVGYYDPERRAVVPAHRAWLAAADQDLADGFGLLQRSLADPSPQPWVNAALAEFIEAYQEIAAKRAIG